MKYPNYNDYRAMYQKYINRQNLLDMMDLVEDYKDKNFMDICAGDGAAAREAFKRGVKSSLILDKEPDMLAEDLKEGRKNISIFNYDVQNFLYNRDPCFRNIFFDIVFCRQGINYWYQPKHMYQLAKWMSDDGIFIFNTFNTKPSTTPTIKEYNIDGVYFTEISYLVDDSIVHHVQVAEGYPPHLTQFQWVSEEDFKHGLIGHFDYEIRRRNNTDVYICKKK